MKKHNYLQGAIILTVANLMTNMVAFIYRMFLTRNISVEGIGLYQLILPMYNLFITLVSGGITTGISKVISVHKARNNIANIRKVVFIYSLAALVWSSLLTGFIILNAEFIAAFILKDIRTAPSIIMFAPAIIFISMASVIKGYFYGVEIVTPPAFIDIAEKATRLVVITIITNLLIPYGIVYVCAGALFSMTIGELISFILLFIFYRKKTPHKVSSEIKSDISSFNIIKTVTLLALPLSISSALNTIVEIMCAILIPRQLELSGLIHSEALSLYGKLTGIAMPLGFFPFVIVASLSSTLIPSIASSYERKNYTALNKKCNDAIKVTSVIAFISFIVIVSSPHELCRIAFNCPEAGDLLFWLSFGIVFEYIEFILFAILNALDKQVLVLRVTLLNILITLICIYGLIPIDYINIYGYIIGFNLSSIVVTIFCFGYLLKISSIKINMFHNFLIPLYAAIITFCVNSLLGLLSLNLVNRLGISIILYIFLLFLFKVFSIKQIVNTILFR